jgi:outer membrane protein assembly factor BamB
MSTCCVHDGLVYAVEFAGVLPCLDAETGKVYWEHDLHSDTWSSPSYVDGKIYMGDNRKVTVFRPGKEKKILSVNRCPRSMRLRWGTPVAANGTLYLVTENPSRLWAIAEK